MQTQPYYNLWAHLSHLEPTHVEEELQKRENGNVKINLKPISTKPFISNGQCTKKLDCFHLSNKNICRVKHSSFLEYLARNSVAKNWPRVRDTFCLDQGIVVRANTTPDRSRRPRSRPKKLMKKISFALIGKWWLIAFNNDQVCRTFRYKGALPFQFQAFHFTKCVYLEEIFCYW